MSTNGTVCSSSYHYYFSFCCLFSQFNNRAIKTNNGLLLLIFSTDMFSTVNNLGDNLNFYLFMSNTIDVVVEESKQFLTQ